MNYSVYNKLNFKIFSNDNRKVNRLKWCFFETEEEKEPDFILNLGRFREENEGSVILSHKYHVKKNYFFCSDHGIDGRWKVEIKNIDSNPEISLDFRLNNNLKNLFLNEYVAQDFILPFLELGLFKKGFFLLHGGAAKKDSRAVIVSGRSGAFKTTVLMDLVRLHGFRCIGDDRVLISDDQLYPFTISHLNFNYTLNNTETERRSLLNNFELLCRMLGSIDSSELPSKSPVDFSQLFIISRMNVEDITIRPINEVEAARKLFLNNYSEYVSAFPRGPLRSFYKYILMYSLIYPNNPFTKYWNVLEKTIQKLIHGLSLYEVCLPTKYESVYVDRIKKIFSESARANIS